jgi:hypothetical protein
MRPRRTALLLMLAAGQICAQPRAAQPGAAQPAAAELGTILPAAVESPAPVGRILVPPPVQWDQSMSGFRPAQRQTPDDFYNLTGGVAFGMSPVALNARLPDPYPGMSWNALAMANEYPGDVRYFGTPIAGAGSPRMEVTACSGAASYVVFLFSSRGLFRLSYRLIADKACTGTGEAAREIFARYVTIGQTVALSVRYRTGQTEVVDVTDPTAGYLIPPRWHQGRN